MTPLRWRCHGIRLVLAGLHLIMCNGWAQTTQPLPPDFALADLLNAKPPTRTNQSIDFLMALPTGSTLISTGLEAYVFANGDAVLGLAGHGLRVRTTAPQNTARTFGQAKPIRETQFFMQQTQLGHISIHSDSASSNTLISGISTVDEIRDLNWKDLKIEWTPQATACYRAGKLLGIWDPATGTLQDAKAAEAGPSFSPANLKDAITSSGLPMKTPRVFTDIKGRTLTGRVLSFDPLTQTLELASASTTTTIKDFALGNLSTEDQACVLIAHSVTPTPSPSRKKP